MTFLANRFHHGSALEFALTPRVANSTGPKRGSVSPAKVAFSVLISIYYLGKQQRTVLILNCCLKACQNLLIWRLILIMTLYSGLIEENIRKETRLTGRLLVATAQ